MPFPRDDSTHGANAHAYRRLMRAQQARRGCQRGWKQAECAECSGGTAGGAICEHSTHPWVPGATQRLDWQCARAPQAAGSSAARRVIRAAAFIVYTISAACSLLQSFLRSFAQHSSSASLSPSPSPAGFDDMTELPRDR